MDRLNTECGSRNLKFGIKKIFLICLICGSFFCPQITQIKKICLERWDVGLTGIYVYLEFRRY
jgi:hypothetical protein